MYSKSLSKYINFFWLTFAYILGWREYILTRYIGFFFIPQSNILTYQYHVFKNKSVFYCPLVYYIICMTAWYTLLSNLSIVIWWKEAMLLYVTSVYLYTLLSLNFYHKDIINFTSSLFRSHRWYKSRGITYLMYKVTVLQAVLNGRNIL
jgi:hypothetical protein